MDGLVAIGRIAGTYGYKGMLKVIPLTDFPERFKKMKKVKVDRQGCIIDLSIEFCQPYREFYLFKFSGIDNRETGQEYSNGLLKVDENEVFPLPEGYYYHFQLKGLQVYDETRGLLGEISDILETGANDVYVLESKQYGEILVPAIKEIIQDIDLERNIMRVRLLPGLIDEENYNTRMREEK